MKHTKRLRRIVAALVAFAMVFSLCMPVLAESGAAQQTEPTEGSTTEYPYLTLDNGYRITPDNNGQTVKGIAVQYQADTHTYILSVNDPTWDNKIQGVASTDGVLPNVVLKGVADTVTLENLYDVQLINATNVAVYLLHLHDLTVTDSTIKRLHANQTPTASINSLTMTGSSANVVYADCVQDVSISDFRDVSDEDKNIQLTSKDGNITLALAENEQADTDISVYAMNGTIEFSGSSSGNLLTDNCVLRTEPRKLHAVNTGGGKIGKVIVVSNSRYRLTADEQLLQIQPGGGMYEIPAEQSGKELTIEYAGPAPDQPDPDPDPEPDPGPERYDYPYLILTNGIKITPYTVNIEKVLFQYQDGTYTLDLTQFPRGDNLSIQGVAARDSTQLPNVVLNNTNLGYLRLKDLNDVTINGKVQNAFADKENGAATINSFTMDGAILDYARIYTQQDIVIKGGFTSEDTGDPQTLSSQSGNVTVNLAPGNRFHWAVDFYAPAGTVTITGASAENLLKDVKGKILDLEVIAQSLYAENTGGGNIGNVIFETEEASVVTVNGKILPVYWREWDGYRTCTLSAEQSGHKLTIEPGEMELEYPCLLLDGVPITPDDDGQTVENISVQYQDGTYTLNLNTIPEDGGFFIAGVADKDGKLPDLVLNNVNLEYLWLSDLNDVTINGDLGVLYADTADTSSVSVEAVLASAEASSTVPAVEAAVNSITVNGRVLADAYAFVKQDLVINGGLASLALRNFAETSILYSTNGDIRVTLEQGKPLKGNLQMLAPQGEVYLTGDNPEVLTAEGVEGIEVCAKTLHAENESGGKIGKVYFSASQSGDYTVIAGDDALEVAWEKDPDTGHNQCEIPADQTGSKLTIVPKNTEPTDPDEPKPDEPGESADGNVLAVVVGVAAGGAVIWGGYELVTRVILNQILPEGAAIPATRAELVKLAWQTAGKPEPAAQPAFADITDPELAKAAQWCVEQGMLDAQDGKFHPEDHIAKFRVIGAWKKAF